LGALRPSGAAVRRLKLRLSLQMVSRPRKA